MVKRVRTKMSPKKKKKRPSVVDRDPKVVMPVSTNVRSCKPKTRTLACGRRSGKQRQPQSRTEKEKLAQVYVIRSQPLYYGNQRAFGHLLSPCTGSESTTGSPALTILT